MIEDFKTFETLYAFCIDRYPDVILENIDILSREIWPIFANNAQTGNTTVQNANIDTRDLLMYKLSNKEIGDSSSYNSTLSKCDILIPFVPCRKDYQSFFSPVIEILSAQGVKTSIMISKSDMHRNISPELFPAVNFIFVEDLRTPQVDRLSVISYHHLKPIIDKLCDVLKLNQREIMGTTTFFKYYCLEKELMKSAIESVCPSVIFGLHYIGHPGYIKGINDGRGLNGNLKSVLIQHAFFGPNIYHDFKGADYVLLWDKYFEEALNVDYMVIPIPITKVIGNPKLEHAMNKNKLLRSCFSNQKNVNVKTVILYISNDPNGDIVPALEMFSQVVKCLENVVVIYKLHPGENLKYYYPLIEIGLIDIKQIIKDVSIYNLSNMVDLVVGTSSSSMYDFIALGKPAIQFIPDKPHWKISGITNISTKDELRKELRSIIDSNSYKDTVLKEEQEGTKTTVGNIKNVSVEIAEFLKGLLTE